MIPKTIHYCWFGGKDKSDLTKKCIESWKKYLPDYEIIEWNEKNTDLNISKYVEKAYREKKWAYLTDYLRLYIIYNNGGIYFDTDVEVIKNLDEILNQKFFLGCERNGVINTGLGFGAEKGIKVIESLLTEYDNKFYGNNINENEYVRCPEMNTKAIKKLLGNKTILGEEIVNLQGGRIYPAEFFCPLDYSTKRLNLTQNTFTIHHFEGSWLSPHIKIKSKIKVFVKTLLSRNK